MNRWSIRFTLILLGLLTFPLPCPAPLIYTPGEGWTYETPGSTGKWKRARAKDQLDVARESFDQADYGTALKAAERTVKVWPLSDYAPNAQYLVGRCYEEKKQDEKAFREYQRLLERYPKVENYQEVLMRQFEIANRFLAGQWFKLWGVIPFFPSMDRTAGMYEKVIRNGRYSEVAPRAQMNIGAAREQQVSFFNRVDPFRLAVGAYEAAADRYHDNKEIAAEALFKAGVAYYKQARKAEYDQSVAGQAIETFGQFQALFPGDARVPEAQKMISDLRTEQARGSFNIARYYEKRNRLDGALVYFNDSLLKDPNSSYATEAKQRIDEIKRRKEAPLAALK